VFCSNTQIHRRGDGKGGDSALRHGEAATAALLLASRVLLYITMRRGAAAPRRASPMDLFSGATQPHQGRLGPEPALSRTRRAQRSGRGSRTLQVCKSATRAGAHAPRKTPLLCARVIPPLFGGGGRICISNLVDSPMQGGDARGNVRYTAIGRISDRVLIATYHHYTTGAPASKVLHLVPPCRIHRASDPWPACAYALPIQQRSGRR
jgi:hypothetical protein